MVSLSPPFLSFPSRRLAEILLEDVAFILLSRVENLLQDDPDDGRWPEAIEVRMRIWIGMYGCMHAWIGVCYMSL